MPCVGGSGVCGSEQLLLLLPTWVCEQLAWPASTCSASARTGLSAHIPLIGRLEHHHRRHHRCGTTRHPCHHHHRHHRADTNTTAGAGPTAAAACYELLRAAPSSWLLLAAQPQPRVNGLKCWPPEPVYPYLSQPTPLHTPP